MLKNIVQQLETSKQLVINMGTGLGRGGIQKMAAKEKNQSTAFGRVFSGEADAQLLAE